MVLLKAKGQAPLLSTAELNQAARDADMVLEATANSSSSVTTYVLSSPTMGTHTVHAQTENGYTMFHGIPQPAGRLLLGPDGPTPLLNDSGAQVSIASAEFASILADLQPAPANMRIFGACNNPLEIMGVGYLYLVSSSAAFVDMGF